MKIFSRIILSIALIELLFSYQEDESPSKIMNELSQNIIGFWELDAVTF